MAIFVVKAEFVAAVQADRDEHVNDIPYYDGDDASSTMVYGVVTHNHLVGAVDLPISSVIRAITQQPMYVTLPSSATPIAANPIFAYTALSRYTADIATPTTQGVSRQRASSGAE